MGLKFAYITSSNYRHGKYVRRNRGGAGIERFRQSPCALFNLLDRAAGKTEPQVPPAGLIIVENLTAGKNHSQRFGLGQQPGSGQTTAQSAPQIHPALGTGEAENPLRRVLLEGPHERGAPPEVFLPQPPEMIVEEAA